MDLSDEDLRTLDLSLSNLVMQDPFEKKREILNAEEIKAEINAELLAMGDESRVFAIEFKEADKGVGEAEGGEGWIPIWGSGRNTINDFQNGRYLKGAVNSVVTVSDLFLVRSIAKGAAKGGVGALGLGNKAWGGANGYRSHYLKNGFTNPGEPLHHWLIHKNGPIGKHIPNAVKNQMWNLKTFSSQADHMVFGHGKNFLGRPGASFLQQLWVGTPTWPKLFTFSYGSRTVQIGIGNENK